MKSHWIPALASLLLAPFAARAATDTWDGGGANNLISVNENWLDNTAPPSDLANTDLIFAGVIRLAPVLGAGFSARSLTFNNTAGAFTLSGQPLTVGVGGILNNDSQTMTFENPVRFSVDATIDAAAGGLTLNGAVTLPSGTLTVTGPASTSFVNIVGSSALAKTGTGTMTWTPNLAVNLDLRINAGTVTMAADGTVDLFNSNSTIAVNGTSTFNIHESLTLDGAQLNRAIDANLSIATGKNWTVQNGGDATITGAFTNTTASTIVITGAGSTLSTTGTLGIQNGSILNVAAGGSVASGSNVSVGTFGGNGTVTVDGAGSNVTGDSLFIGQGGRTGSMTFSNGSTGQFTTVGVDQSSVAGTSGSLAIQSGATVTGTSLLVGAIVGANTGTVTVTGTNSALTLSGAAEAFIGASSASSGTLNVNSSGTFNSGTGRTTVNPTGRISISSGTYNSNGDLTLNGGTLVLSGTGILALDASTTVTVQNGGDLSIANSFSHSTASIINVTGAGSTFVLTGNLSVEGGGTLGVSLGGVVQLPFDFLRIGSTGTGTVTVDGVDSRLQASATVIGELLGNSGALTFSNGSTGSLGAISVANTFVSGSGLLSIQSGATVTGTGLIIAPSALASSGTVTITGAGSSLSILGSATGTIGAASASAGTLNVDSGATFESSEGLTTVNATGRVAIAGGTFNANGDLVINGGQLSRDAAGTFALDPTQTLTVQNGGDAVITGTFTNNTASTIVVTGAGSTFSTTGVMSLGGGSTTTISGGGSLSSGAAQVNIGNSGHGNVTVTGAGSTFTAGILNLGGDVNAGTLAFSSGSTGTFTTINVDNTLAIQSGSTVTGGRLDLGTFSFPDQNRRVITVTGAGSTLSLSGFVPANLGSPNGNNQGGLEVSNGGTFNSGTGPTTVHRQFDIDIQGGTYRSNGNLRVNGGSLVVGSGSSLVLAAGTMLTVEAGGVFNAASFSHSTPSTINVIGTDSRFSATNGLSVNGDAALGVFFGGQLTSNSGPLRVGNAGSGVVTVDGPGSLLRVAGLAIGEAPGNSGVLTVSNNGVVNIDDFLAINVGTVTFTGTGSQLLLSNNLATIGTASGSSATLNVQNGGRFRTFGPTTLHNTGTINLDSGTLEIEEFTVNGTLAITGTGIIRGFGRIIKNSPSTLNFPNSNTYTGGTIVRGGTLVAGAANGALGTGNVTVESAAVKLTIQSGVLSAIADNATLTLAGGGVLNVADNGFAELAAGVNDILAGLVLGTTTQPFGTYGSTLSPATFQNDEFFSGPGILTVIPEPGSATVLLAGISALLSWRRFRRGSVQ